MPPRTKVGGYDYSHADHQWSERFDASATRCYELKQREHDHRFHSDLRAEHGLELRRDFGGPVHDAWYGKPFCFRIKNELPADHSRLRPSGDHPAPAQLPHRDRERRRAVELADTRTPRAIQHYCMARAGFADPMGAGQPLLSRHDRPGAGRQLVGDPVAAATCARR